MKEVVSPIPVVLPAPVEKLHSHLSRRLADPKRASAFDMDDETDAESIRDLPLLNNALEFLNAQLRSPYRAADQKAVEDQRMHRNLARTAIVAGGASIICAILQLALSTTATPGSLAVLLRAFEGFAVLLGVVAVAVGVYAKYDHEWLIERHKAERLRMLKFSAFGRPEFWEQDTGPWKRWVEKQIAEIDAVQSVKQLELWTNAGRVEPFNFTPPSEHPDVMDPAIAKYYRIKRVDFQSAYFITQANKLGKHSRKLSKWGLPLFLLSVGAVLFHFAAEFLEHNHEKWHIPIDEVTLRNAGIWFLALAVLLPTISLCIRAWIGAFEFARSSYLFEAKHNALAMTSQNMIDSITAEKVAANSTYVDTMRHVANVEHFLEHEHREWLRLMMSAEWFI